MRSGINLQIGQRAALDFRLKVAKVAETVTVMAEAPIIDTSKSAIGANITTRQIDELPLSERNFQNLIFLTPGITTNVHGGGVDHLGRGKQRGQQHVPDRRHEQR